MTFGYRPNASLGQFFASSGIKVLLANMILNYVWSSKQGQQRLAEMMIGTKAEVSFNS